MVNLKTVISMLALKRFNNVFVQRGHVVGIQAQRPRYGIRILSHVFNTMREARRTGVARTSRVSLQDPDAAGGRPEKTALRKTRRRSFLNHRFTAGYRHGCTRDVTCLL